MAANNEALLNSFANLLRTLTPAQVSSISASLQAASATTLRPLNADDMTPMVEDKNEPTAAELEAQLEGKRKLSRAQRRMAVIENHKKTTKRPLNGFIAYRTYYSPLIKGATQKAKSGLLRTMWGSDNKRSMWTLLGEAYSNMRDHHAEHLPVDKFLDKAVKLLPIIPAELYLSKMGWMLTFDAAREPRLTRSDHFNAESLAAEYPVHTNLSSQDIVDHCYDEGLMDKTTRRDSVSLREKLVNEGLMHDPFPDQTQPPGPPACGSLTLVVTPQSTEISAEAAASIRDFEMAIREESVDDDAGTESTSQEGPADQYLTIQAVTDDQQAAYEHHALALHFHPTISPPILGFDPRIIQDDFDPFNLDLSAYIDWNV